MHAVIADTVRQGSALRQETLSTAVREKESTAGAPSSGLETKLRHLAAIYILPPIFAAKLPPRGDVARFSANILQFPADFLIFLAFKIFIN